MERILTRNLPEKIKIGCYTYEIEITDKPLIIGDKCSHIGLIDYHEQKISIDQKLGQQAREQTLWHEIIHGICHDRKIEFGEDEEKIIDSLANGMLALMKDNKSQLMPGQ
jgi:Zn-dependent peptidase ImmA (M78 family)